LILCWPMPAPTGTPVLRTVLDKEALTCGAGRGALKVRLVRLSAYSAATAALASKWPGADKPQIHFGMG